MRFALIIIAGIIICSLTQYYSYIWWIFAPIVFLLSLTVKFSTGWRSFFSGFLIVTISWLFLYIMHDIPNNSVMSNKMATVFSFPNNYLFFIAISIVMGIIAGMCSTSAYLLRKK